MHASCLCPRRLRKQVLVLGVGSRGGLLNWVPGAVRFECSKGSRGRTSELYILISSRPGQSDRHSVACFSAWLPGACSVLFSKRIETDQTYK